MLLVCAVLSCGKNDAPERDGGAEAISGRSAEADGGDRPTGVHAAEPWTVVHENLPAALLSIWGTSARDVWAVGADAHDGLGPVVLHHDGEDWERLATDSRGDLWWVHGFEDGPVLMSGSDGMILRYEQGRFERMRTPDDRGTVFGVWGIAPDDLWAVGARPDESGFVWRSDGGDWRDAGVPAALIADSALFKVRGRSSRDIRLVGANGLVLRYDGAAFERMESGTKALLFTVHPDGEGFLAVGAHGDGVILQERESIWRDLAPAASPALSGVAVRDGRAFAAGINGEVMARRDGAWRILETGLDIARDLHAVWVDPEGGVWAVGGHVVRPPLVQGVLIHGPGDGPTRAPAKASSEPECRRHGECDNEIYCDGDERCEDGQCQFGALVDCDDGVACTADACDEALWACRHLGPDGDGDGHGDPACLGANGRPAGDDCDDADPARVPGGAEECDFHARDEDCDFSTVGETDEDGDGFVSAQCCNADSRRRQCGVDCDDADPRVHPDANEMCNVRDDDCDGRQDEGVLVSFLPDRDQDGYGAPEAVAVTACRAPNGYADQGGDCDDRNAAIRPSAPETCDAAQLDQNCDGDPEPESGCECEPGSDQRCPLPGACAAGRQRCVDRRWTEECSIGPTPEVCNELDDDCDGETDETASVVCFEDGDGDGYAGSAASGVRMCLGSGVTCPSGFTATPPEVAAADCAPTDMSRFPAAPERCNGIDDDCDETVDEGLPVTPRFADLDGDGHAGTPVMRCAGDPGSTEDASDCMDDQPLVHEGQSGFFATPACTTGRQACSAGDEWRCRASPADACAATLPLARWDYDCNDVPEPTPTVSTPCSTGDCSSSCGQSGFQSIADPRCGQPLPYQVCRCLGIQGGGCAEMIEMLPLTCR